MATSDLELLKNLQAALFPKKQPPKGFRSVIQFAKGWGLSVKRTQQLLLDAHRSEFAERVKVGASYYYKVNESKIRGIS